MIISIHSLIVLPNRILAVGVMAATVAVATAAGSAPAAAAEPADGAASDWSEVKSGVTETLRAVFVPEPAAACAVGDKGTILRSADGGRTWERKQSPCDGTIRGLHFCGRLDGFAVADGESQAPAPRGHILTGRPMKCGSFLVTKDGGETWTRGGWIHTNFELRSVWMVLPNFGQVCNHGGSGHPDGDIIITRDGSNFRIRRVSRGLNDCFWTDENTGVAVGSRVMVRLTPPPQDETYTNKSARIVATEDGGNTWTTRDAPGTEELRSVWFADKERGVAVGDKGAILRTADGGKTWYAVQSGTKENLYCVAFADSARGFAVGGSGTILESADGGASWKPAVSPTKKDLLSVHAAQGGGPVIAVGKDGTIAVKSERRP